MHIHCACVFFFWLFLQFFSGYQYPDYEKGTFSPLFMLFCIHRVLCTHRLFSLIKFEKVFSQYFFNYFFLHFSFFFWDSNYTYVILFDIVILGVEALFIFLSQHNFCWLVFMFTKTFFSFVKSAIKHRQLIFCYRS